MATGHTRVNNQRVLHVSNHGRSRRLASKLFIEHIHTFYIILNAYFVSLFSTAAPAPTIDLIGDEGKAGVDNDFDDDFDFSFSNFDTSMSSKLLTLIVLVMLIADTSSKLVTLHPYSAGINFSLPR